MSPHSPFKEKETPKAAGESEPKQKLSAEQVEKLRREEFQHLQARGERVLALLQAAEQALVRRGASAEQRRQ